MPTNPELTEKNIEKAQSLGESSGGDYSSGNRFIEAFTEEALLEAVTFREQSINYFPATGRQSKRA